MRWVARTVVGVALAALAVLEVAISDPLSSGSPIPGEPPPVEVCGSTRPPVDAATSTPPARPSHVWDGRIAGIRERLERMAVPLDREELEKLLATVERNAARFDLDPLTVLAVIDVESRFDPRAVSRRGAMGLMQLRVETAKEIAADLDLEWSSDDLLFDPEVNVVLGTAYLGGLVRRFGDMNTALVAFHSGPGRIDALTSQGAPVSAGYADRIWAAVVRLKVRALA
jgi:hypothetical protein